MLGFGTCKAWGWHHKTWLRCVWSAPSSHFIGHPLLYLRVFFFIFLLLSRKVSLIKYANLLRHLKWPKWLINMFIEIIARHRMGWRDNLKWRQNLEGMQADGEHWCNYAIKVNGDPPLNLGKPCITRCIIYSNVFVPTSIWCFLKLPHPQHFCLCLCTLCSHDSQLGLYVHF